MINRQKGGTLGKAPLDRTFRNLNIVMFGCNPVCNFVLSNSSLELLVTDEESCVA
jgi:hypothetical protein